MQNNFCTCKFKLGIVNFPNLVEAEDDPLCKLFEDYKWPYQDPITKQRKNMSLFDVINSQTHQEKEELATALLRWTQRIRSPGNMF